ncbi:hypothetical protein CRYUN_Cryun35bG0050100 [Craigia yunnanensis]
MCESQKRQATEGKSTADNKIHDNNDGEEEYAALPSEGEVSLGELIWVKLHKNSWWPALVVDENSVSGSSKPGNRSQGKVLVRLYGSYEYLYADPMKYYSEFKMILEQNNGSCYELLDKALEQDCSRRKSIKRKGEGSKSTANKGAGASKGKKKLNQNQAKGDQVHDSNLRKSSSTAQRKRGKTSEQGEEQKKVKPNSPNSDSIKSGTPKQNKLLKEKSNSQTSERTSPGNSPKLSTRRMRVMQGLGLVAPPGSPFHKNGLI